MTIKTRQPFAISMIIPKIINLLLVTYYSMQLQTFQKDFNILLNSYLQNKINELLPFATDTIVENIIKNLIPFQEWWKRIRPFLVKTIYNAFEWEGEDIDKIIISNELLHSMALVHDDIMDLWNKRHGQDTYHKKIEKLYNHAHAWVSQWILVWDWLQNWAVENLISTTENKKAIQDFMEMIQEVIMWQIIDIHFSHIDIEVSADQIKVKDKLKSWYYTFMRPMKLGGILANISWSNLQKIMNFWEKIGLAYQMRDDLLDITWTNGHDNKTRFSDLTEWNQTIVLYEVLQRVKPEEKELILSHRSKKISPEDIEILWKIIENSGALEATKLQVNTLLDESQLMLDALIDSSKKEYTALTEIINYLRV